MYFSPKILASIKFIAAGTLRVISNMILVTLSLPPLTTLANRSLPLNRSPFSSRVSQSRQSRQWALGSDG